MERVRRICDNERFRKTLDEIDRLEKDRRFCRHSFEHLLDTARIMYITALEEKISIPKDVIYAAALLHDIGRAEQYKNNIDHNEAGKKLAETILPECGYNKAETEQICDAVLCHREKNFKNNDPLSELLKKADRLSRLCFLCKSKDECYWSEEKKNKQIDC